MFNLEKMAAMAKVQAAAENEENAKSDDISQTAAEVAAATEEDDIYIPIEDDENDIDVEPIPDDAPIQDDVDIINVDRDGIAKMEEQLYRCFPDEKAYNLELERLLNYRTSITDRLTLLKEEHISYQSSLQSDIAAYPLRIEKVEKNIERVNADGEFIKAHPHSDTITIEGVTFGDDERTKAGAAFEVAAKAYMYSEDYREYNAVKIGEYCGFNISLKHKAGNSIDILLVCKNKSNHGEHLFTRLHESVLKLGIDNTDVREPCCYRLQGHFKSGIFLTLYKIIYPLMENLIVDFIFQLFQCHYNIGGYQLCLSEEFLECLLNRRIYRCIYTLFGCVGI